MTNDTAQKCKIQYLFQIFTALGLWTLISSGVYQGVIMATEQKLYLTRWKLIAQRNKLQTDRTSTGAKIPKREYLLVTCEFLFLDL